MAKTRGKAKTCMTVDDIRKILPDFRSTGANILQARFAACYISNGMNGPEAYKEAKGQPNLSHKAATSQSSTLLSDPAVRKLLLLYTQSFIQAKKDELEPKILKTLWARAFWDPAEYFDEEGQPRFTDWNQVPLDMRMAVESIELQYFGQGATRSAVKMKMASRHQAIAMLAQYVGMLKGVLPGDGDNPNSGLTPDVMASLSALYAGASKRLATEAKGAMAKKAVAPEPEEAE